MDELQKDTRLLRRNLAKGFISQAAVDELLNALPDVADRAEWIDIEDSEDAAEATAEGAEA